MASRLERAAVFAVSFVVFLGLAELLMRRVLPADYYIWPPHFTQDFHPEPGIIDGVDFPSRLTINADGMRGDPLDDAARYRLLAVGGSTTICVYLDDARAWPYRLQQRLNAALGDGAVWLGNVGRPGHTTAQHVLQVEKLLAQYPEIDGVLLLVGINDLLIPLAWTLDDEPPDLAAGSRRALAEAFSVYPVWKEDVPWYLRNPVARLWRLRSWRPVRRSDGIPVMDAEGTYVRRLRAYRSEASALIDEVPDRSGALAVYRANLHRIVDVAAAAGTRLLFVTQPTLYRADLAAAERALLWGGGPTFDRLRRSAPYYSPKALASAMESYNDALLDVCRARGVECLDAARALPRDATIFYDDAHFTERGADALATLLARHLLASPPLATR